MRRWLFILTLLASTAVQAHKPSDSYLQLKIEDKAIHGEWDIALRDLEYAIGIDTNGDGAITWGEVRAHRDAITAYAMRGLEIQADSESCIVNVSDLQIADHSDGAYAALILNGSCVKTPKRVDVDYGLLFELDPTHHGLLNLDFGGIQTAIFRPDLRHIEFRENGGTAWSTFLQYLHEGLWHVWTGYDHMLFLGGLMLPAVLRRTRQGWLPAPKLGPALLDTVRIATAFTIAHAFTLSLAAMGVISLPSRLVESLVAATVVFAGINNLFPMAYRGLWQLAFFFGLIHGAAIASALLELGLPSGQRVLALFAFNLGVEAAQLTIVGLVLPISFVFRYSPLYRRAVVILGSIVITGIGLIWLIQRAFAIHLISFGS